MNVYTFVNRGTPVKDHSMKTRKRTRRVRRNPAKRRTLVRNYIVRSNPKRKAKRKAPARAVAAKATRKKAVVSARGKRVRPTLYKKAGKFYGSKRGYVRSGTRINPRRSIGKAFSRATIIPTIAIGGGVATGAVAMPFVYRLIPSTMRAKSDNFLGLVHFALGLIAASMAKKKDLKLFYSTVSATGLYDLGAKNIPQLGLPALPRSSALVSKLLPGSAGAEAVSGSVTPPPIGMNASYETAHAPVSAAAAAGLGSSYTSLAARQSLGASYLAPGMNTAGLGSDFNLSDYIVD